MMALPKIITPEALAKHVGWSVRRVRKLARDLGACRIFGNRMVLLPEDVTAILEASKPCPTRSTSAPAVKTGITGGPLPNGDFEALQKQRARKLPTELPPQKKLGSGKVISMDRHRS